MLANVTLQGENTDEGTIAGHGSRVGRGLGLTGARPPAVQRGGCGQGSRNQGLV